MLKGQDGLTPQNIFGNSSMTGGAGVFTPT